MNDYMSNELYHYGVPGMKWGHRKKIEYSGEGVASRQKKSKRQLELERSRGINPGANKRTPSTSEAARKTGSDLSNAIQKAKRSAAGTELAKRGKSALDVLMNGDTDWMGNKIGSDDATTEARNRGKAALERLMYSQEQIDNKKFFGDYNPFD